MPTALIQTTTIVFTTDTGIHCRTVIRKPYTASAPTIEITAKFRGDKTTIVLDDFDNLRTIFRFPVQAIRLSADIAKQIERRDGDSADCYEIIREGIASLLIEFSRCDVDLVRLGKKLQDCIIADCTIEIMG